MSNGTDSSYPIDQVRSDFPVLQDVGYMNIGTYGIMPKSAFSKWQEAYVNFELRGIAATVNMHQAGEDTRQKLAEYLGVDANNIAFTRNATDGINLALSGLNWNPGDEVITTDEEHEAMAHPLFYMQTTRGIRVRRVKVTADADEMINQLNSVYNSHTRLVALSYVTCETGIRLPAKEICAWAAERNILSLIDGAQSTGAFPVSVEKMGCDFYVSNGHKWLCGPKGTGLFYGKSESLEKLSPAHIGAGSLEKYDFATDTGDIFHNARKFEFGTRSYTLPMGLGASLDWFASIGWGAIYDHIRTTNDYLKEKIQERSYLRLLTPLSFDQSSGLTTVEIIGFNMRDIITDLVRSWKIYTRPIPHYNAVRISTAPFNNREDIDRLMTAIDAIVG